MKKPAIRLTVLFIPSIQANNCGGIELQGLGGGFPLVIVGGSVHVQQCSSGYYPVLFSDTTVGGTLECIGNVATYYPVCALETLTAAGDVNITNNSGRVSGSIIEMHAARQRTGTQQHRNLVLGHDVRQHHHWTSQLLGELSCH